MKGFILLITILILIGEVAFSQNALKALKRAEDFSKSLAYASAIDAYENLLKRPKDLTSPDLQRAKLGLAEAYFLTKDNLNADRVYADVLQSFPILKGDDLNAYKRYAQVLSALGRYSDSKFFWEKYNELNENDKRGVQFVKLYAEMTPLLRNQASYKVEYVGLNSGFPDFSPAYYNNGLVFVSGRKQGKSVKRVFNWDNSNFLDLFYLEDEELLRTEENNSAVLGVGGSNVSAGSNTKSEEALGKDYYTPSTSNDAKTIGHTGSEKITGSQGYKELPIISTKSFSKKINSKYHEGPSVFYNNGNKIIFTRNAPVNSGFWSKLKGDEITKLKLYSAEKTDKDWGNIAELPFNSDEYSCGHPAITNDGKLLYFVSDKPGGFGGTDLYYSTYANGKWSPPINAGPKINTIGDEMFPFIDASGNLYYSTDGLPGLGSLDIFVVKLNLVSKEPLTPVRNLGAPLNSQYDDFGIITDSNRSIGYFSSNRKRGGTDDDIYKFTRVGAMFGCRDVIVTIKDSRTGVPLDNLRFRYSTVSRSGSHENVTTNASGVANLCLEADQRFTFEFVKQGYKEAVIDFSNFESSDFEPDDLVVLLEKTEVAPTPILAAKPNLKEGRLVQKWSKDHTSSFRAIITDAFANPISGAKVRFINKCTGGIQEMNSRRDGTVEFIRDLECDYELVSAKDGFTISRDMVEKVVRKTFFGRKKSRPVSTSLFNTKLYKVGDIIRLENIYYTSDGYKLNASSKAELTKLAEVMIKYPDMAIEVVSHTDTRGNAVANLALSDKRAKEVLEFLTKHIEESRIRAVGKGESEPVNNCGDGVQCTETEHARNRRTEFKILRMEKI